MDIGKIFDNVLKPIAEKYNEENLIKCRYEVSDSKLWGLTFDGQLFEVTVSWVMAPGLDKPLIKKHPLGEDYQTEIIRGVRDLKFDNFFLELMAIKKDWTVNGVKHTFRYKIVLNGVPQVDIVEDAIEPIIEPVVEPTIEELEEIESIEEPIKKFRRKLKEVKDGKS